MSVISKLKVWIGSDTSDLQKGLKKSKKEVSAFGTVQNFISLNSFSLLFSAVLRIAVPTKRCYL